MTIKYKDFEKREQLRKDYMDKAAEAARTQANAYTDEQIKNIPAPPAPDIPTSLPQKYEAFKVQLVQDDLTWEEYHKPLWNGNIVLTTGTWDNSFVTDTIIDYPEVRKYSLLLTVGGVEKELKYVSSSTEYNTYACTENGTVVLNAAVQKMNVRNNYYNNTTTVYVYCPTGSALIGQSLTAARYGKKQYVYTLMYPEAVLQQPSETENARFLTMCQSIATKNAKIKLTITDNVIEANYINISNELVTTDENLNGISYRIIGIVADRKALEVGNSYEDDMPTCIKGVLEVEYTDAEATKECVYDKIQGESYTFKIGDFNHDESSAFDYYFNGAILIPFSNAQIQANFTYRPVSGTEKSVQVKSMVNNGQMLPYFDISELFGQAANTVMAAITSNTAVENVDMSGRPVTTISLPSNIQNFTDANDEIMVGQILTIMPNSLPQTYKKKAVTLATSGWVANDALFKITTTKEFVKNQPVVVAKLSDETIAKIRTTTEIYVSDTLLNYNNLKLLYYGGDDEHFLWTSTNTSNTKFNVLIYIAGQSKGTVLIYYTDKSGTSTVQINAINAGEVTSYDYAYTDADVKVNSEVRFTLDEANGKLAGQFGLKKTIDKEAGKLTFTADTLPTSAISGTLEIGDTSTEGAAFVEGISSDTTGFVKATEENTFTAKQTFQDVQINGNLTAKGTTTTVDVKNLDVEQQLITVAKGNTAALTSPAGLKAEKYDGTKDGALVFDASGTAMVGDVVLDADGNIDAAQSDLQDLATRAKPSELTDGHLLKWDATNKKIVDGGTISSGGVKGKRFTFTEENIVKLGNDVNFSMTTSQNYAVGSTSSHTAVAADNRGMLQFEVGKSYKLEYQVSDGTKTTVYAVASSMALSDGTTVAKAEFAVNGKTLVVVDRATATANITSEASLTYSLTGAVAYFSDFSTVAEYLPIHVFTIPKEYYVRIPFDETILSTDIVAIFTDKIAPTSVTHSTSYIELNYGVSSSVYYASSEAGDLIHDYAKFLIGTDYYLAIVGSSTAGEAYVVSAKQENINERSTTVLVSEWVSETGGTFKWTDSGSANSSLIEYGVVWNSEVKLSFATETDKETFEAAGCKIVSGKTFATPLTITCTTKPTKPICFTYTVRNNAR